MTIPTIFAGRRSHAAYLVAGQSRLHSTTRKPATSLRQGVMPGWLASPRDLDFLDPANPFFYTDRALFSFGQYLHRDVPAGMFSPRAGRTILADSGGFQFIDAPEKWEGDATREWFVRVMDKQADEAITLDIPTGAINPSSPWPTFNHALQETLASLAFIERAGLKTRLLNAQQGRDLAEARAWYAATKAYRLGGWALGGALREDVVHIVRVLAWLKRDGLLGREMNRIHVLGLSSLTQAVALTAIQRGLRESLCDDELLITFDTSTASFLLKQGQAFSWPRFGKLEFASGYWRPSDHYSSLGSNAQWPVRTSSIGSVLRIGDLMVAKSGTAQSAWDALGEAMLVNHNVHTHLAAIQAANEILELDPNDARQLAPAYVVNGYTALRQCFRHADPVSYLRPYATDLQRL